MLRHSAFPLALVLSGCIDASSFPTTHWTVVGVEITEMGEEWEAGPSPGPPMGYTVAYAKCQRGTEVIYLDAYNLYVPGGLDIGDTFSFTKALGEMEQGTDGEYRYYVVDDADVVQFVPGSVEPRDDTERR